MDNSKRHLLFGRLTRNGLRILSISSAIMLVISFVGVFITLRLPAQVKQETPLVKYEQQGTFDYLVLLKPSYLFGSMQDEPPPTPKYPTEIVDRIDFTFTYGPLGGTSASGWIDAVLENPGIWQKNVRLASGSTGGGDYAIHFSLDLVYLQNLMDDIQKEIKVTGSSNITLKAEVTAGEERFVQTLPVKLSGGLIEVDNNLTLTKLSKTGKFEYRIRLKPPSTGAKSFKYPAQIVESIQFTYDYSPVKSGATSGWIEAVLENPGIWQKSVRLASNTSAAGDLTIMFPLDFNYFQNLYSDIDKEIKLTSPSRDVTIKAYVNSTGGQFIHSLPVKISANVIEIDGDLTLTDPFGSGKFDYKVQLKPNSVYDTQTLQPPETETASGTPFGIILGSPPAVTKAPPVTLKPGDQIFAKLVDSMNVTFQYRLKSDKPIKNRVSDVNIEAVLDAPKLWSKTFSLSDVRKTEDFKISFPLDLDRYREVYDAIRTETGTSPESYDLIISAKVRTVGETSFGKIDETFTQTMKGTLKGGLLEWDKELTKTAAGSINESKIVPNTKRYLGLPVSGVKGLSGVLAVIFSVSLLLSIVAYVRSKPVESFDLEKEMLKIKKKYGERIAEATSEASAAYEKITLSSMEDLIKIADELAKPIIYQASGQTAHTYVVFDGLVRYEYILSPPHKHEVKHGESTE